MIQSLTLDEFLKESRVSQEAWKSAQIGWDILQKIGEDHERNKDALRESAEQVTRFIQRIPGVHSVGWELKDTLKLLAQIVLERSKSATAYRGISAENYYTLIPDLVGLRVTHLFQGEHAAIDKAIRSGWSLQEKPVLFVRKGEAASEAQFPKEQFSHLEHPFGYRAIRYVLETRPQLRTVLIELQVKTVFEDGWCEIDRIARQAGQSDATSYLLMNFERLAMQADEMGTFFKVMAEKSAEPTAAVPVSEVPTLTQEAASKVASDLGKAQSLSGEGDSVESSEPVRESSESSTSAAKPRDYPAVGSALKQLNAQASAGAGDASLFKDS